MKECKRKTLVVNLIGGPGSGKSTCASGIFYQLKKMGVNCELALEFAKDKVWEESIKTLDDQFYIFGKQYHKLFRLNNKVDVIITDSPLIISLLYNKTPSKYFNDFVIEQYNTFDNMLFFIDRPETYQTEGRIQTESESKYIDGTIKKILKDNDICFDEVNCDLAVDYIVQIIKKELNLE
jgi:nicotinamide riboside kinase